MSNRLHRRRGSRFALCEERSKQGTRHTRSASWLARAILCAVVAEAQLVAGDAFAYRTGADVPELASTQKVRWEDSTVEYEINEDGAPGIAISEVQTAVADAARSWASIACGGPDFRYVGLTSNHAVPSDGRNTIEWVSAWTRRGFQADAAGQTDVQYEQSPNGEWRIVEADIYLNAENHVWSSGISADESTRDIATVLTHELGHALGLMHPCEPTAQGNTPRCVESLGRPTMHPVYGSDQLSLEPDDEAGACFLYPSANCAAESCAPNQLCTRNGCKESCGGQVCTDSESCVSEVCVSTPACAETVCPQSCKMTSDCGAALSCIDGECRPGDGQRGDVCEHDQDCHSGSCVDKFCSVPCDSSHSCRGGETCQLDHDRQVCFGALRRMGEVCTKADDCLGNQCLVGGQGGPVCTRLCTLDAACPSDWKCSSVDGRSVCTPSWFDAARGCSMSASPLSHSIFDWPATLALAFVWSTRQLRRRRSLVLRSQGR